MKIFGEKSLDFFPSLINIAAWSFMLWAAFLLLIARISGAPLSGAIGRRRNNIILFLRILSAGPVLQM